LNRVFPHSRVPIMFLSPAKAESHSRRSLV
jgi:hypothetical protein